MKTTVDLPDKLLREVKAISAQRGISMKEFMIEALQRTVQLAMNRGPEPGWKQCFGTFRGRGKETRDIQNTIDREFSRIDPKDWK